MGNWTPAYLDDVLRMKVKNMVSGAIKRSRLDKGEPIISYESFVRDLDEGDSFTATLIEVLVKEIADRRTRQGDAARRLITERTAKSLHLLTATQRIYHARTVNGRSRSIRSFNAFDYMGGGGELETHDDDDDDTMAGVDSMTMEGVRMNADLFDAYRPSYGWSMNRRNLPWPGATPPGDHEVAPIIDSPPPATNRSLPSTSISISRASSSVGLATRQGSSALTRQAPIRRPHRSRTVDFNEFTSRRRSTVRQGTEQESGPLRFDTSPVDLATMLSDRSDLTRSPIEGQLSTSSSTNQLARRFFPFSRRHEISEDSLWRPDFEDSSITSQNLFRETSPLLPPPPPPLYVHAHTMEPDDRASPTSRLRRGSIRPPESMLSRYASPPLTSSGGEGDSAAPENTRSSSE